MCPPDANTLGPAGGLRYYKENMVVPNNDNPAAKAMYAELLRVWSPTPLGFSLFPKELVRLPLE